MKRQILITMALAAFLAVPASSATWFAYGTYEPDTIFDAKDGFMQSDPTEDVGAKAVYFNVYQTEFGAGTSINTGTLGSRYQMAGLQNFNAILGPWVDCNKDDFVGTVESALPIYRAELLTDASVCPVGSLHNDGEWVYEYVPIGYNPTEVPQDPQVAVIEDKDSLVWGDIGLPGSQAAGTCPISPLPHGTTAGSGWLLRYVDCFIARRVANTVNTVDSDDSLGLKFDDPNNPQQSDSLLNQHFPESLFGNPTTGETGTLQLDSDEDGGEREYAFTTWDCNGRLVEVKDPTGLAPRSVAVPDQQMPGTLDGNEDLTDDEGNYAWVARPAPAVHDPTDSVADGVNQTFMGVHAGSDDSNNDASFTGGDCDFESASANGDNDFGGDNGIHQTLFFRADSPFEQSAVAAKKENDDYFIFFNGGRNSPEIEEVLGERTPLSVVSTATTDFLMGTAQWGSNTIWLTSPQAVNRNTLTANPAAYWTFYGRVGDSTFAAGYSGAGATGIYGSEACGSHTSGVHNGWDCDQSHWYTDSEYQPIVDGNEMWQGKVGYTYQFRDIDCNDGTVARGSGVRASLTDLAPDPRPCQDAP